MFSAESLAKRQFQFERDTFSFAHELVWEYCWDNITGQLRTVRASPPPTYYHRCFVMVRAARQFFYHARFEATLPAPTEPACRKLIQTVIARNPRRLSNDDVRVVVPGYEGLRAFSKAWEPLLKAECGAAWESYFLRSHWRMVLPVSRRNQAQTARRLAQALQKRAIPAVHLFRFPQITINHGILLFAATETDAGFRFEGYDPNIPARPVELVFREADHAFYFPGNHYWKGGKLTVVEIYRNWLY